MRYLIFILITLNIFASNEWKEVYSQDFSRDDNRFFVGKNEFKESKIKDGRYYITSRVKDELSTIPIKLSVDNEKESKVSFELERVTSKGYPFFGTTIKFSQDWKAIIELDSDDKLLIYAINPQGEAIDFFNGYLNNFNYGTANNFTFIINPDEIVVVINDNEVINLTKAGLAVRTINFSHYGKVTYAIDNFILSQREYIDKEVEKVEEPEEVEDNKDN